MADLPICGLCKQPATGYAAIGDTRYCHGDLDPYPTCYERACHSETVKSRYLAIVNKETDQ